MGMAASQARYLALTARKTNAEYEGQQINQARTALANQSANLFNRLLNMDVPQPPSTSDYTKLQYSYSDGDTASVIDEWEQLSTSDPNYNYLVKTHYYMDLYTGALKKMADPQVQIGEGAPTIASLDRIDQVKNEVDTAYANMETAYTHYQNTARSQNAIIADIQSDAQANNAEHAIINSNIINYQLISTTDDYTEYSIGDGDGNAYSIHHYYNPTIIGQGEIGDANAILQGAHDMLETGIISPQALNTYLGGNFVSDASDILPIPSLASNYSSAQIAILEHFGLSKATTGNTSERHVVRMNEITDLANDLVYGDHNGLLRSAHRITGTFLDDTTETPTLNSFVPSIDQCNMIIAMDRLNYSTQKTAYEAKLDEYNNLGIPTYIGNSELTYLNSDQGLTKEQQTELLQIITDMRAQGVDNNLSKHFDSLNNYTGGIYSFKMNGTTYYAAYEDLVDAYNSYQTNSYHNNYIDGQYKMPYYNATYVNTKIEQTAKALMETDGNGRFKSVRFDNNSIVYNLNTETITDEAAYQDAMNRYVYEKEKYEKTIADINAKTSIIQKEDRTLELRLKQLDTEQNALKTEMDAVKKVIKDNVESTFKTFSD